MITLATVSAFFGRGSIRLLLVAALWASSLAYTGAKVRSFTVAQWEVKMAALKQEQRSAHDAELARIAKANDEAKAVEAEVIEDLEASIENLETLLSLADEAAKADPVTAAKPGLSAGAASRLGRIGR